MDKIHCTYREFHWLLILAISLRFYKFAVQIRMCIKVYFNYGCANAQCKYFLCIFIERKKASISFKWKINEILIVKDEENDDVIITDFSFFNDIDNFRKFKKNNNECDYEW